MSDLIIKLEATLLLTNVDDLAPLHSALVEIVKEAKGVLWINECRCNVAYTGRQMHEPNALCGEMDLLKEALTRLAEALK